MGFLRRKDDSSDGQSQAVGIEHSSFGAPTLGHPGAEAFIASIRAGDHARAAQVYESQQSWEDRSHLLDATADLRDIDWFLENWIAGDPHQQLPHLARGARRVALAWEIRGAGYSSSVSPEQAEAFVVTLRAAETDLWNAAQLDQSNPIPWGWLITSGRGLSVGRDEAAGRFVEMYRRFPLYSGHLNYLQYVCAKWFGSHHEMFEFAHAVCERAPDGSPLKAVMAMSTSERILADLPYSRRKFLEKEGVFDSLIQAAESSVLHPAFPVDRPDAARALNAFAFALYQVDQEHLALPVLNAIGDRVTPYPLAYGSNKPMDEAFGKMSEWIRKWAPRAEEKAAKAAAKGRA